MKTKNVVLAGGCFWGTEAYFQQLKGVVKTEVGYAQGHTVNPTYEEVCSHTTGYAEVVSVEYDPEILDFQQLLNHYFRIIDPTSVNKQGHDIGDQYRTGIYVKDPADMDVIKQYIADEVQPHYQQKVVVEVEPLKTYYSAEQYHQDYLIKNPNGYCHVNLNLAKPTEIK